MTPIEGVVKMFTDTFGKISARTNDDGNVWLVYAVDMVHGPLIWVNYRHESIDGHRNLMTMRIENIERGSELQTSAIAHLPALYAVLRKEEERNKNAADIELTVINAALSGLKFSGIEPA